MNNVRRIVTGVIGFPLVVLALMLGNNIFIDIVFAIIAVMSLHEYYKGFRNKAKPIEWVGYLTCILIGFIHIIPRQYWIQTIGICVPTIILLLFLKVILTNGKTNIMDVAVTAFGIAYIPLFLMFIPILMANENGKLLVWYIIVPAWGTDVFAYTFGRTIGKHKFSEISPNKTIEGCIGGTIGATVLVVMYTVIINTYAGMNISYVAITAIGIILSIIGQLGDFAASSIKRYVGIKDFSNLIPGHGGMLDRIDSIIFISPFAYFLITMFL